MTADLVAFLLACLDEDEATARREVAEGPSMHENGWELDPDVANGTRLCWVMSPAAVLADVEWKRAIIEHHEMWLLTRDYTPEGRTEESCTAYRMAMVWTVTVLSSAYRHRTGWRDEWT